MLFLHCRSAMNGAAKQNHVNGGTDNPEKIVILDAGAQYGKVSILSSLIFYCTINKLLHGISLYIDLYVL